MNSISRKREFGIEIYLERLYFRCLMQIHWITWWSDCNRPEKTRDLKTCICCPTVCKHLQWLVSEADTILLRFLYSGEASEYLPCCKSHYRVPQSAFTALMKVFANMKSLKIKLCPFPSLISCYGVHHGHAFTVKLMEEGMDNKILSFVYGFWGWIFVTWWWRDVIPWTEQVLSGKDWEFSDVILFCCNIMSTA